MQSESVILQDDTRAVRELSEISHLRTIIKLLSIVIAIGLVYVFARIGNDTHIIYVFILAFLIATWAQHAIGEELHDGSHYRLASSRRVNEYLASLYGSLSGISLMNYRARHKLHHRYFGTALDPDFPQYKTCPMGLKAWATYLFVNFSGYGAIKSLVTFQSNLSTGKPSWQHPGFTVVMQLFLLILGILLNVPIFYFLFWFVPLLTLTYGVSHFRTMLEHWNAETWQDPTTGEICYGAFYDFDSGIQSQLFGAPFGYNHHGTHHSLPSIPNYNLDKIAYEDYREVPQNLIRKTTFFT
ncbi:MAG: fatty acid desaturase, partial [Chloroflexota bacterium]